MSVSNLKIDFGTLGLRGPAKDFALQPIFASLFKFLNTTAKPGDRSTLIGADLRENRPEMRCYAETVKSLSILKILNDVMKGLKKILGHN